MASSGTEIPHPRIAESLFGHAQQEQTLLSLIQQNRLPHTILLTGARGIGKATLAYRLARFLLTPAQAASDSLFGEILPPTSLHVPATSPVFSQIAALGHPDLCVLEGDAIPVEEVRNLSAFLSLTPAMGGWRIAILDAAEALQTSAANALLKTLEEPPPRALLLLVSHQPGLLLPTLRSRCWTLRFSGLSAEAFSHVLQTIAPGLSAEERPALAELSHHAPGVAAALFSAQATKLYEELLTQASTCDTAGLHALADRLAHKNEAASWPLFSLLFLTMLRRAALQDITSLQPLCEGESAKLVTLQAKKTREFLAEFWERANLLLQDTQRLYLDRKQTTLSLFTALAA